MIPRHFWLLFCLPLLASLSLFLLTPAQLERWRQEAQLSQQAALQTAAEGIAAMLIEDERFLGFISDDADGAVYRSVEVRKEITLDGRVDDWPVHQRMAFGLDDLLEIRFPFSADSLSYRLSVGSSEDHLYLHYEIADDFVVYRELGSISIHRNDHIQLGYQDREGNFHRLTLSARQPGEIDISVVGENGRALRERTDISGRWMATERGYNVELRLPRSELGRRFSTLVADVDEEDERNIRFMMGASQARSSEDLGRLVYAPTDLERLLAVLPYVTTLATDGQTLIAQGVPRSERSISVSVPMFRNKVQVASLSLEQSLAASDYLLGLLRWDVFRLSMMVMLIIIAATVVAVWMARRQLAVSQEAMKSAEHLRQYNDYLERMASRLNHELRTPISVVKSSLENLSLEHQGDVYVGRAQEGITRLTSILNKMAEARRLEEALDEEEVARFNLAEVVAGCVDGYRLAYPEQEFTLNVEQEDVPVTGIPELVAQMLDKLVDNAVEFSDDSEVMLRLHVDGHWAVLRVINSGPGLPEEREDLLESMVSVRGGTEPDNSSSHLGLGLYIARVVADFHGGSLSLANREEAPGATATIRLPLLRISSRLR